MNRNKEFAHFDSVALAVGRVSVKRRVTGPAMIVVSADYAFQLSFDGTNWFDWNVGRSLVMAGSDDISEIRIRNKYSYQANTINYFSGTARILEQLVNANKSTTLIGFERTLAAGASSTFTGEVSEAPATPAVGPQKRWNRKAIKFFNLGAGDLDLVAVTNGGYCGVVKAGTASDWIESNDSIKIENNTAGNVLFRAMQLCFPDIIARH